MEVEEDQLRNQELCSPKVTFATTPSLTLVQVAQAWWETETNITVSTALKSGVSTLDKAVYEYA